MEQRLDLFDLDLAIGRSDGKQLTTCEFLRCAALINVNVGRLGTDDCVMRRGTGLQTQNVGAGATKDEIDLRFSPKVVAKKLNRACCIGIVAVGNDVPIVGGSD